ncbi:MAG: hypothetical protein Q9198_010602, partial [Flavoplaca austrocitrina]
DPFYQYPGGSINRVFGLIEPFDTGAWVIHIVLIVALKIFYSIIPGIQRDTSWFLTNLTYMFGSYLMFHWVRGIPFEFNAGAYDNLNMWEQMDNGEQFTPTKKYLLSVPICLFLVSTHYTHYDLTYFTLNVMALLGVIIPKLPWVSFEFQARIVEERLLTSIQSHRLRVRFLSGSPDDRYLDER